MQQSGNICDELSILSKSPWKLENHRSVALNEPRFPLSLQLKCQAATPLLDLDSDFSDCQEAELHYPNGSSYSGQSKNSMRFGKGAYYFTNKDKVLGHFINDQPVGRFNYFSQTLKLDIIYSNEQWQDIPKGRRLVNGFIVQKTSQGYYIGQMKSGYFYGQGKLIHGQEIFSGQFKELLHGPGLIKDQSGLLQVGSFFQAYCQGYASMKFTNGCVHTGQWTLDMPDGSGKYIGPNSITEGNWVNGKKQGYFVMNPSEELRQVRYFYNDEYTQAVYRVKSPFTIYTGEFKNAQANGQGTLCYNDNLEIGNYENGLPKGLVVQSYNIRSNQQVQYFKGNIVNSARQGLGYCYKSDQITLGDWHQDQINEQGTLINFLKGMIYTGGWSEGYMHGYGEFLEGEKLYVGDWIKGERSGKGKQRQEDNSVYEGDWYENERNGFGIFENSKLKYEGYWSQGKRSGKGKLRQEDNSVYEGDWKDDKMHGSGSYINPIGIQYIGYWQQDQYCWGITNNKMSYILFKGIAMIDPVHSDSQQTLQQESSNLIHQSNDQKITNQLTTNTLLCYQSLGQVSKRLLKHGSSTQVQPQNWGSTIICGSFRDGLIDGFCQQLEINEVCYDTNRSSKYRLQGGYFRDSELINGYDRVDNYEILLGSFKGNKSNGQGTSIKQNGDFEIGNFYAGVLNGYGVRYLQDYKTYLEGTFSHGVLIGNCQQKMVNHPLIVNKDNYMNEIKQYYIGECKNDLLHGQGSMIKNRNDQEQSMYSGSLENGRQNGLGSVLNIQKNGGCTKGHHSNGKYITYVLTKMKNNKIYIGEWFSDQYKGNTGSGIQIDNINRVIQIGNFLEGRLQGYGIRMNQESSQSGYFVNDIIQKNVIIQYPNMGYFLGQAKDAQIMVGILTHDLSSTAYMGEFQNKLPHGYGSMIPKTGPVYEGTWSQGLQDGYGILYTWMGCLKQQYQNEKLIYQFFP